MSAIKRAAIWSGTVLRDTVPKAIGRTTEPGTLSGHNVRRRSDL
jgi:hypothetical protein